jgi:hypothetical protein
VFTARYALSPYIKQIRFVFEGLIYMNMRYGMYGDTHSYLRAYSRGKLSILPLVTLLGKKYLILPFG